VVDVAGAILVEDPEQFVGEWLVIDADAPEELNELFKIQAFLFLFLLIFTLEFDFGLLFAVAG
jgi:hypothetical protein